MRKWIDVERSSLIAAYVASGDEDSGAYLAVAGFGRWVSVRLPNIIPPHREKVKFQTFTPEDMERIGRDWYWRSTRRQFGFVLSDGGYLSFKYGRQTFDSATEKSKGFFLPWTQWRFVRHSYYGLDGEHLFDENQALKGAARFDEWRRLREAVPKQAFNFTDYDGERITATTYIEEREWHRGEGGFKWLSRFIPPMVRRSLDIAFSAEVGPRKGSWKGGTLGHGIEMLRGELHEAAFRRYCLANNLTFVGRSDARE